MFHSTRCNVLRIVFHLFYFEIEFGRFRLIFCKIKAECTNAKRKLIFMRFEQFLLLCFTLFAIGNKTKVVLRGHSDTNLNSNMVVLALSMVDL